MTQLHERAEQLFAQALSLPLAERPGFLAQACAGELVLLGRVEALLRGHATAEFLESSAVADLDVKLIGTRIGRYKLLEKIGEGGSGAVYLAEQEEPIRRRIALKIIKAGMDTREVIARFEAERQILAVMDHPNIARVYDCGATEAGRPYFVMELVQGTPITRYCDDRRLSVPERLGLFVAVCRAIQHAHEKGIVHRDIKPSNVLVTAYDGAPSPKVIDFGVAKATETRLSGRTLFTAAAQFIGTPAYMSPEQADLGAVDARSDVYSLGVLLYELLTGFTPFDGSNLASAGLEEMRRRMREEAPPRPSQRVAAADPETQAALADRRQIKPADLIALLRRDLDGIVMHCIERQSVRRYVTAVALATDITAYLRHEPVGAAHGRRPPPGPPRPRSMWAAVSAALLVLIGAGLIWWRPWSRPGPGPAPAPSASPSPPESESRQLLDKALRLYRTVDSAPSDFRAAEALLKRAEELDPSDGEVWAAEALINRDYGNRGFDLSPNRGALATTEAEQAVKLAPNSALAWLAHGAVVGNSAEGEADLRRAIALAPPHGWICSRAWFVLGCWPDSHVGFSYLERSIEPQVPGSRALACYGEFLYLFPIRQFAAADAKVALAVHELPDTIFVCGRCRSLLTWRGDTEAAEAALSLLSTARRGEPRAIFFRVYTALLARKPKDAIDVLDSTSLVYLDDASFAGPTNYLRGLAEYEKGDLNAANIHWQQAYAECQRRDAERTPEIRALATEGELLGWLGRRAESYTVLSALTESGADGWRGSLRGYAALGDADRALPLIRKSLALKGGWASWPLTTALLRLDPLWDKLRPDPRFQALASGKISTSAQRSAVTPKNSAAAALTSKRE